MSFPTFDVNNNRSDHTGTFNIDGELHSENIRINASGPYGATQPVLSLVSDTANATYIAATNTATSPTNLFFQGQKFFFNSMIEVKDIVDILADNGAGGLEVGGKNGGYVDFTYGATSRSYRDNTATNPFDFTFRFICDGSDNLKLFHSNYDSTTNTNARTMTMLDFERDGTDLSLGKVTLFQTGIISSQGNESNSLDDTLYFAFKHTDSSHEQIKLRDDSDIYMGGKEISFFTGDTIRANEFIKIKNDRTMKFWVGDSDTANNESLRITCSTNTRIDLCGNIHISTDRGTTPQATNIPCLVLKNGGASDNTTASQIKFCYANKLDEQFPSYISSRSSSTNSNNNALDFRISNGTNTSSSNADVQTALALTLTGAGRVGIGKTNPSETLDVSGNIRVVGELKVKNSTGGGVIKGNDDDHAIYLRQGYDGLFGNTSFYEVGDYRFFTGGVIANQTEKMRITQQGNVGIGTTNPSKELDVSGNARIGYNTRVGAASDLNGRLTIQAGNENSAAELYLKTPYSTTSSGKAAIIAQNLTGAGGYSRSKLMFCLENTLSNTASATTADTRMTILPSGNVGIGSTNPQTALQISSSSGLRLSNTVSKTSANDRIGYIDFENLGNGAGAAIESCVNVDGDNNGDLRFMTTLDLNNKYVERMRIDREGRVGIGTMEPTTLLDISGELKSKTVSIEPNGLVYDPNQSRPMGLVIANETTSTNEFAALHLSNRGDSHPTARTIFQIDLQDINSGSGAGQRKIMFTGRTVTSSDVGKKNFMTFDANGGGVGIGAIGIGTEDGDTGSLTPGDGGYYSALNSIRAQVPRNTCQVYGNEGLTVSSNVLTGSRTAVLRLGSPYQNSHDAYCAKITSTNNQSTTYAADLRFYTSSTNTASAPERMCIATNGNVGIGTAIPTYPLHVHTSNNLTGVSHRIWDNAQSTANSGSSYAVNLYVPNYIYAGSGTIAGSDERIKKDILDINDDAALQKLRIIEPKTYKYKDVASRGTKTVFGFIAQQIDTVLPEAVSKQKDVIPNTYELCNATSSSNNDYYDTIHFTDFNTANLDASSNNLVLVDANNKNQSVNILSVLDSSSVQVDTDLLEWMGAVDASGNVTANEVQKYKKVILDASNNVVLENYDITSIASMDASDNVVGNKADLSGDNTIDSSNNYVDASGNFIAVVNSDGHYIDASGNYFDTNGNFMDASNNLVGTYKTEWKKVTINGTKIFVYGQNIDDFNALNKEYIFTVATAALQEVDRQLQAEKAKVSVLESDLTAEKAKTATLESQMADLLTRVSALESA